MQRRGNNQKRFRLSKSWKRFQGVSLSQAQAIGKIHVALNEKELAFSWLERGLATGAIGLFYKDEPVWDPIRNDASFADLLKRMGIPQ